MLCRDVLLPHELEIVVCRADVVVHPIGLFREPISSGGFDECDAKFGADLT